MPLEIANVTDMQRCRWTEWDKAQLKSCRACKYLDVCGGLDQADDSRFCGFDDCGEDCIVFCCFNNRAVPMLDELGGAEFTEKWKPFEWEAPDFMWVLKDSCGYYKEDCYVIPIDRLFDQCEKKWVNPKSVRRRFEIPAGATLAVSFCAKDDLVEMVWDRRFECCRMLAKYGVTIVFPIDCSCYNNFPRADTLVNLKRRMHSMELFQEAGFNVIPDVGAFHPLDRDRWTDWMVANKVKYMFCTCQTVKAHGDDAFDDSIDWLVDIREKVGPDVKFYLAGVGVRRVPIARQRLGNVGLVDSAAAVYASMKTGLDRTWLRGTGLSSAELFAYNRKFLRSVFYGDRPPVTSEELRGNRGKCLSLADIDRP